MSVAVRLCMFVEGGCGSRSVSMSNCPQLFSLLKKIHFGKASTKQS